MTVPTSAWKELTDALEEWKNNFKLQEKLDRELWSKLNMTKLEI